MDTRKIQSVGGGTYTVSLPKGWSEHHDIDAGDVVNVHQHSDGLLAIQTRETDSNSPKQVTIEIAHGETEPLEQAIRAVYTAGMKELVLVTADEFSTDQQRVVNDVAKTLTGVSVADASNTEITVQVLLNRDEVSVSQSVRQLKSIALSMQETALESLTDRTTPSHLATQDDHADRLYAMIDRSFTRSLFRLDEVDALGETRPALFKFWKTTRELERVADQAERIAAACRAADGSVSQPSLEEVQTFGRDACAIVSDSVEIIVGDAAVGTAQDVLMARDDLCERIRRFVSTIESPTETAHLRPLLQCVRRTAKHGGNVAECGIQHAMLQGEFTAQEPVFAITK